MLNERDYYRNPNPYRRPQRQGFSAVWTLIFINLACFLLQSLNENILGLFALDSRVPFQVWRLVSYQFFHAGFSHLFWNMYGVWLFGRMLEMVLGKTRFYILYLFSGVLGGIFFLLANMGSPAGAGCIGASGAEFGVMVATAVAFPQAEFLMLLPPIRLKLWVLALIYCGLEIFLQFGGISQGIAHMAHLGGALGGFIFMRELLYIARHHHGRDRRPEPEPTPEPEPDPIDDSQEPFVFNQDELNRILDKVSRQGYAQLTAEEKRTLRRAANELKKNRN